MATRRKSLFRPSWICYFSCIKIMMMFVSVESLGEPDPTTETLNNNVTTQNSSSSTPTSVGTIAISKNTTEGTNINTNSTILTEISRTPLQIIIMAITTSSSSAGMNGPLTSTASTLVMPLSTELASTSQPDISSSTSSTDTSFSSTSHGLSAKNNIIIGVVVGIGASLLFLMTIAIFYVVFKPRSRRKSSMIILQPGMSLGPSSSSYEVQITPVYEVRLGLQQQLDFLDELNPDLRSHIKQCLLDFSRVTLQKQIGKGYFGKVYSGTLSNDSHDTIENVAIKALHAERSSIDDKEDFLQEAAIMIDFEHDNVLSLRAIAFDHQTPYVILQLMELGDLKTYISNPAHTLSLQDLINFGLQIAEGMEYLSSKGFLHRDLAASNCMINKELVCKVADFGLARDVYQKNYYKPTKRPRPLPIKWSSIEALKGGVFTTKSDIWSYGVLLWELLTRGEKPYADVDSEYMVQYLENNHRLEKPPAASEFMYEIMKSCWLLDPLGRPEFKEIKCNLKHEIPFHTLELVGTSEENDEDRIPRSRKKLNSYIELFEVEPDSEYLTN